MPRKQRSTVGQQLISIIVPMYNEAENVPHVYQAVLSATQKLKYQFEYLFIDDGSNDETSESIYSLAESDDRVVPIELARNFGKEIALTAGLHAAQGEAAIMLDADLQHPPSHIPEFVKKWERGADVVIGVRKEYKTAFHKKLMSRWFYKSINKISDIDLIPHATDFRMVDRHVIDAFNKFTERNRITRGLFDWLGYRRDFVYFVAHERQHGKASYSLTKLIKLGMDSFVSHTLFPLRLAGYIGTIIMVVSVPLAIFVFVDRYIYHNTLFNMAFSGNAILAVISLFLSGVMLACLGLISLYIANIHQEVINRPLYVVRRRRHPKSKKASGAR